LSVEPALALTRSDPSAWIEWSGSLALPALAFVLVLVFGRLGIARLARTLPSGPDTHWSERARYAAPISNWIWIAFLVTALACVFASERYPSQTAAWPNEARSLACFAAAQLAALVLRKQAARRLGGDDASVGRWLGRCAGQLVLFSLPVYGVLGLALFLPSELDPAAWLAGGTTSALSVFFVLGGGVWTLSLFGLARRYRQGAEEAAPALQGVWIVDLAQANAFALPVLRQVVISERALQVLTPRELECVLGHERGHLAEPAWMAAARILPALLFVAFGWWKPLVFAFGPSSPWWLLALLVAAWLLVKKLAPGAELAADARALAAHSSGLELAGALEHLHAANLTPAVARASSHPDLWRRLEDAGVAPSFARPPPPLRVPSVFLIASLAFYASLIVWLDSFARPDDSGAQHGLAALVRKAVFGGAGSNAGP
jgi:Zn-dependent protease with chaperone function